MTIQLVSRGIKFTDDFRRVVERGIGRVEARFSGSPECRVTLKKGEKDTVKVSVLVSVGKYVFKGEGSGINKEMAFNKAVKNMEKRLDKVKTRQLMKRYMPDEAKAILEDDGSDEALTEVEDFIVAAKQIKVTPMTIDEAYMQMDLLGHTFFVFINKETALMNILYKKTDSNAYGLIELVR